MIISKPNPKPPYLKILALNGGEWALLLLAFLTNSLLSVLLFYSYRYYLTVLIFSIAIALGIIFLLRKFSFQYLLPFFVISLAGALGIIIGGLLDFGPYALFIFSSICNPNNYSGVSNLYAMAFLAPWTHLGMWGACNLALFLFQYCHRSYGCKCQRLRQHLYCFIGMVAGMWLIQKFPLDNLLPQSYSSATLWPIAQMWLGMSAGMFVAFVFQRLIMNGIRETLTKIKALI